MKVQLSSAMTLIVLSTAGSAALAQEVPEAEQVLERVRAALGAPASASSALRLTGTATWQGMPDGGTFTEVYAGLRRARVETVFEGFGVFEHGTDGQVVWEKNPLEVKERRGWDGSEYLRRFGLAQHVDWREMYASAGDVARVERDGRSCYRLELVPRPLLPMADVDPGDARNASETPPADVWHVDAQTWLPLHVESRALGLDGETVRIQHRFADWRPAAGGKFPFHKELEVSGFTLLLDYEAIERDVALTPDFFALPEDVATALARVAVPEVCDDDGLGVSLVSLEPRHIASIRVQCARAEMQKNLSVILPEAMRHVTTQGATMAGPPVVRYHQWGEQLDIEGAMQVAAPIEAKGRVQAETLPGGQAAVAWHVGPYEKLSETHEKLQAFLAANELEQRGAPWEEYWTDPGMEPDPEKWRTRIVIPVTVTSHAVASGAADVEPGPRVALVTLEPRAFAAIRTQCSAAEMQRTLGVILPEAMRFVASSGAQASGPPMVRYHQFGEQIDLEGGVPLAAAVPGKDRVEVETLPGGAAAVIWHVGPYHELAATHAELQAYVAAQGLEQRGALWEEYWTDPGMEPDPRKWRTKVVMPVVERE